MAAAARIWLVGAAGMLGRQLGGEFARCGLPFVASDREVDVRDRRALEDFIGNRRPVWIVNCAAYTAVDRAEDDEQAALAVNADGVENLARLAARLQATLVHFSTDYVFAGDGGDPYREQAPARPLSAYGRSKLAGEKRLAAVGGRHFLFRISWLYGVHGANFVHTMLRVLAERERVRVVCDQYGSPTYAAALAANLARLLRSAGARGGTYHYCDQGVVSWFAFACAVQELALEAGLLSRRIPIDPVASREYPTRARRPLRAVLDAGKATRDLGFAPRPWRANLEEFFREKLRAQEKPA